MRRGPWLACLIALAPVEARAADLAIVVRGLYSGTGAVHYAVYDRPETFPTRVGRLVKGEVPAATSGVRIVVPNLRPGRYAVAVFHDENGNGEFDQGLFGIPLEQYGFSNDARGFFGPPDFEDAAVDLGEARREITITLER